MEIGKIRPVVLCILDGWGIAPPSQGNAISLARLPNMARFLVGYPNGQLGAAGEAVGLPHGEEGNTEVGHLNIGAGHTVYQDLPRINMSIADGTFFQNQAFLEAANHVRKVNSNLHLMGLIGSGGVHSSLNHLYALLRFCHEQKLQNVYLHLFTDGRDSPTNDATNIIIQIAEQLQKLSIGKIATISGRYYAMDRDNRYDRTEKAYNAIVKGLGEKANSPLEAVNQSYQKGRTDEFIFPTNIVDQNQNPIGLTRDHDAIIFFNYRIDRSRQLTKAFVIPDFENIKVRSVVYTPYGHEQHAKNQDNQDNQDNQEVTLKTFERGPQIDDLFFVTMTEYEKGLPVTVAYLPTRVLSPLAQVISNQDKRQLHITETEKERFVTYYFNGLREDEFPGEDRIIIPSSKVATYDLKPEMSAVGITDILEDRLKMEVYDFVIVNFANADMVGHTGNIKATIKACEIIDECLGKLAIQILSTGGALIITADHGNAEEMISAETGEMETEHSTNPVPFIAVSSKLRGPRKLQKGILADIAPTILSLMDIPKPQEMTGRNLLQ